MQNSKPITINLDEIVKEQVLTSLIQERDSQILSLATRLNELEKDNGQLRARLEEFEKKEKNVKEPSE